MHTRTPYQPTSIPTPRSLQEDRDSCSDSAIVRGSPSRQTIISGVIDQVFCLAFRFAGVARFFASTDGGQLGQDWLVQVDQDRGVVQPDLRLSTSSCQVV